ncbi:ABC transporter permease [Alicyclobacillus shizuokensis]|uniref:ABC transporter permease n=1 Tax=Alicyclobacillus shizuokensis TaxID=392014 RepID=UPI0008367C44|nr:ABC transporter permease [Alicyclobacillus shizuokensis]MCL6626173.1 ABC transporter permease [Alicyclobacillus shizuokensis]
MWSLLGAEMRREWIQLRRYPTELASQLVVIVAIFYSLFLGASYMAGTTTFGNRLSDIIVGYTLWTLAIASVDVMGWTIATEALNGTLEQIFLSPYGARCILLARNAVNVIFNLIFSAFTLLIIMALTGRWLTISPWDLLPGFLMTVAAMGLGFLVASATILVKRSNQLLNLLQFVLLFLVMSPFGSLPGAWHLVSLVVPFAPMVTLLRHMMTHGVPLWSDSQWLYFSITNAAVWFLIGLAVFSVAERRARKQGVLGHY